MRERKQRARGLSFLAAAAALATVAILVTIVVDLAVRGGWKLSLGFLVEAPRDAGRSGGIGPILVSTLAILATTLFTAVPIGVAAGVYLSELARAKPFGAIVRRSLDVLAAVPSIVFGLFGNALFCHALGLGFSILSGGLTLACMVLPILIRTVEESLRSVPDSWRMGGAALSLSRTTMLARVLLPAAAPGIAAGIVLGIGRALSETAALVFTSGYVSRAPGSLLDSGRALSVHVYDLALNVPRGEGAACASALVLLGVLAVLYRLAARWSTALARRLAV